MLLANPNYSGQILPTDVATLAQNENSTVEKLMVDLIPEELQDYNRFSWAIGIATNAKQPVAAAALVRFLTSAKAALVMKKKGMEPGAL